MVKTPKPPAYHNPPPTNVNSALLPKEAVKAEFARKLQHAFTAKGWTQSELARQAEAKLPKGHTFGRYNVSTYVRGKSLPGPVHLKALCDALGVKPDELLPTRGVGQVGSEMPPLDVRDMADGNVWLRINQAVPWPIALKIMELLKGQ